MRPGSLALTYVGGGTFEAANNKALREADRYYKIGSVYRIGDVDERSPETHKHFFAQLRDLWGQLPDAHRDVYPTVEHLRKKLLIKCGFHKETMKVFETEADAKKAAAMIEPLDEYAIVAVEGCVVRVWTAKSQAEELMGRTEFQQSKNALFAECDELLRVPKGTSQKQAGLAA